MCGIFGYVGKKQDAAEQTLEGLKLLEYRGYDSWGIASRIEHIAGKSTNKNKHLFIVEKHIGKIGNATLHAQLATPDSHLAIGHTRWATHGGVTEQNAHPHLDCHQQIAVVHNGIIENFTTLKKELLQKGHTFVSETDTEVVAHLVEEHLKTNGFATSVKETFNQLEGCNAIVVAYAPSKEIVAAKNGSPIVIGKSDSGYYVTSDIAGIIKHTRTVLFLKDNEMVILGDTSTLLELPSGRKLPPVFQTVNWQFEEGVKGNFPHFLLKEIHEQPHVIENIAYNYLSETEKFASLIEHAFGTFMLGCGTASYAALTGTYFFSSIAKKHVNFSIGSEFMYLEDYLTDKSLVIPISQSGETIDVIEPMGKAKQKGATIAAITNVLGSTLYRQADFSLLLGAGPEKAVIATKSFIAMSSVLLLTAYTLAGKQALGQEILLKASSAINEIISEGYKKHISQVVSFLSTKEHIFIIGRGISYPIALEAALKLKETCYVHAEGFAGGELKHGVMALIENQTPCIVFAPDDETYAATISNAQEMKARGGVIIGISPKENEVFDYFLKIADCQEATGLLGVVIAQLIAYNLALQRGIEDPDKPRNLAKSVTVK